MNLILAIVLINEIAWMGTATSANDEWIELYNPAVSGINLDGWQLIARDGTPEINLLGTIPAESFYLLERTDDETVPGISADLIYKGALGNTGEDLKLYDNSGNLIDEVNYSGGWTAGDNKTKQTMERGWQTSANPGGTPKQKNSKGNPTETGSLLTPSVTPSVTSTPSPIIYNTGIVFNEILPSPEGADAENEWIEIYNQNNFEVDLSGWQIKDSVGTIITYTFPKDSKIGANGFLILKRPDTKIILNNDGDELNLMQPDKSIIEIIAYEKAPLGQSYNRIPSGWAWSLGPTLNVQNNQNNIKTKEKTEARPLPEKNKIIDLAAKASFVELAENNFKQKNLLVWLVSFFIALLSAAAIFILKKSIP